MRQSKAILRRIGDIGKMVTNLDVATAVANYLQLHPPSAYTHPSTHPASIITESSDRRFITDIERAGFHLTGSDNQDLSSFITTSDPRLTDARQPLGHSHIPFSWASGITTKNITDVSGVQNIPHGLGRVPTYVRIDGAVIITTAITQMCTGVFDGINNRGMTIAIGEGTSTAATDAVYTSTSIALGFSPLVATNPFTGANRQTGVISVDATNIIITWTKTGTVASLTASLIWQCT